MTLIQNEPKKIYIGNTEVKSVRLGETKVRPTYKPRTFTITRTEKSDMSSGWTYSDDAAGLTAGDGAFDDFFGYSAVLLNTSGVETAEMTQSGGVFTGAMSTLGNITSGDNVMIKFPVRGIKMSKSGSTVTLSITEELDKDGYQYYAHTKGTDIKDNLYLGAYLVSEGYKSLSGAVPTRNTTITDFRGGIKSAYDNSAGINRYSMITLYPRWYLSALYMMKYGNPRSQDIIGQGRTSTNTVAETGGTNSQTDATYGNVLSYGEQCKLFGLEDRWGNLYETLDGCYYNSSTHLTVDKTNSVFQDSTYATDLGGASSGRLGRISGTNDGMFMCIADTSRVTNFYTDGFSASSYCILTSGGSFNDGANAGVFRIAVSTVGNSANNYTGTRLQYL